MVSEFTEKVWELMSPSKNGFVELSDTPTTPNIPKEIIEFKIRKTELAKQEEQKPVVEVTVDKTDASADMTIMREYLKEKGIKVHHLVGYDKLKAIYDENREPQE